MVLGSHKKRTKKSQHHLHWLGDKGNDRDELGGMDRCFVISAWDLTCVSCTQPGSPMMDPSGIWYPAYRMSWPFHMRKSCFPSVR